MQDHPECMHFVSAAAGAVAQPPVAVCRLLALAVMTGGFSWVGARGVAEVEVIAIFATHLKYLSSIKWRFYEQSFLSLSTTTMTMMMMILFAQGPSGPSRVGEL